MEYEVLPEFLNQQEQRIGGMLTPFQVVGAAVWALPMIMAAQKSLWSLVPLLLGMGLTLWGLAPAEGTFTFQLWLLPLLASLPGIQPPVRNWRPFRDAGHRLQATTPLYFEQGDDLVLVADVVPQ